jgi:hypothetical protein
MKQTQEFTDMMAWLAQGAINIGEGNHNTFEVGSPFFNALTRLIREVNEGRLGEVRPQTPGEERGGRDLEGAIRSEFPEFQGDGEVNGGDLVEFVSEWLERKR